MDGQIEKITLQNWYQFDVEIKNSNKDTVSRISKIIDDLKSQNSLEKWFYLYEVTYLRIRFKSTNDQKELKRKIDELTKKHGLTITKNPDFTFGPYWEDKKDHLNLDYIETFASVMSLVTELNIKKFNGQIEYGNFRLVDMLSHCIFNSTYHGLDTETYFLLKRLSTSFDLKDDPELTGVDELEGKITQALGINIPLKVSK